MSRGAKTIQIVQGIARPMFLRVVQSPTGEVLQSGTFQYPNMLTAEPAYPDPPFFSTDASKKAPVLYTSTNPKSVRRDLLLLYAVPPLIYLFEPLPASYRRKNPHSIRPVPPGCTTVALFVRLFMALHECDGPYISNAYRGVA